MNYGSIRIRPAIRHTLTIGALVAGGVVGQAFAQEDKDTLDTVIVTGSRIATGGLDAPIPVQVYTSEQITAQGTPNIADVLARIPAIGTAGFSRANSNFATTGNGVSTVNLRNIDDKRTLVLVNGRRVVAGIGGNSAVDVSNIPTALIDRIEVVTGGASAVYGSEAIAGVVNFILKNKFDGLEARGQVGHTSKHDAEQYLGTLTFGTNLGERAHAVFNLQYDKDEGLRSRDREISKEDIPFRSSYVPQGLFSTSNFDWTYGPDGALKDSFDNPVDGFNRNSERYISVPLERKMGTLLADMDIVESLNAFFEGTFVRIETNSRLEPLAFDNSDARLDPNTPLPGLALDNPFIPAAILADMNSAGDTVLPFRKRANGMFDRSNVSQRDFYRAVLGLKGSMFDDWDWDVYYNTSKSVDDTRSETGLRDRLYYALDATTIGGQPACRDAAARAAGCVPLNLFGFNSHSAAAVAYFRDGRYDTYKATIEQEVFAANVTGSVFSLPAGEVRIAAGAEYRKETSSETYSADTQAGNTLGNALSNTVGEYDVTEAYFETIVPLLTDLPAVQSLEAQAAVRVGDYSSVGEVLSWKTGLSWAPMDALRFRAVYATATRAPNIGELYQGENQDFPPGLTDPCEGVTAASARPWDDYCRSIPGVAQQIALNGTYVMDDNLDRQSIEAFDRGNVNVQQEKAKTLTLGVVLTPFPNLSVSVDWFSIRVEDAIRTISAQYEIDTCVISLGTSEFCQYVVREPVGTPRPRTPGAVYQIFQDYRNLALIESRGMDTAIRAGTPMGPVDLDVDLNYTYLDKLSIQPVPGEPSSSNVAQLNGEDRLGAGFRHRVALGLTISRGGWAATWRHRYQSAAQDTREENNPILEPEFNNVSSFAYEDLYMKYEFGRDQTFTVYGGINNLMDVKPPLIDQNGASNITGTETAAESYDPIGRYMFAGLTWKL